MPTHWQRIPLVVARVRCAIAAGRFGQSAGPGCLQSINACPRTGSSRPLVVARVRIHRRCRTFRAGRATRVPSQPSTVTHAIAVRVPRASCQSHSGRHHCRPPGSAGPLATPSQSKVTAMPANWQLAVHWSSLITVFASFRGEQMGRLRSASVPGHVPADTPLGRRTGKSGRRQSTRRPTHWQLASHWSLTRVRVHPSLHAVPGGRNHLSTLAVDRLTRAVTVRIPRVVARVRVAIVAGGARQLSVRWLPSQSRSPPCPHWQLAVHWSLIVFGSEIVAGRTGQRRMPEYPGDRHLTRAVTVRIPRVVARVQVAIVAGGTGQRRSVSHAFAVEGHRHYALAVRRPLVVDRVRITVVAGRSWETEPPGAFPVDRLTPRSCSSRPWSLPVFAFAVIARRYPGTEPPGRPDSRRPCSTHCAQ